MDIRSFIHKHDLLGCIQCGRCTGGCPVTVRSSLNIRRLVYGSLDEEELEQLAGLPEIWDCTTCGTCKVRCPKGLKPVEVLLGLRNILVEGGVIQPTVRDALESVFREGNPWDKPKATRLDWMQGLDAKMAETEEQVKYLVFVCCTVAYDSKLQVIARNLVRVLNSAGVSYGFIGEGEACCSSEVYNLGECGDDGGFEMMRDDNTDLLNSYHADFLVTVSPHCYDTFKNQYTKLKPKVLHYTQLLNELLQEEKIQFKHDRELSKKIVYHDPCYLGKRNDVYDEPRRILSRLPGAELTEFDRGRERSLCCEGGGGKMWVETESKKERLAEARVKDARRLGADILAVSCPFCLLTMDDAIKAAGLEEEMKVMDVMQLVGEAL